MTEGRCERRGRKRNRSILSSDGLSYVNKKFNKLSIVV